MYVYKQRMSNNTHYGTEYTSYLNLMISIRITILRNEQQLQTFTQHEIIVRC